MKALSSAPFEQKDGLYYLFDQNSLVYPLPIEQFHRFWKRITYLFALIGGGSFVWLACAVFIWGWSLMEPSDLIGLGGITRGQVPDWFFNPFAMFALAFCYWALTWRFSVSTWRALAPLAEPQSEHSVSGGPNPVVLMSKPKLAVVMGVMTAVCLAVAFAIKQDP